MKYACDLPSNRIFAPAKVECFPSTWVYGLWFIVDHIHPKFTHFAKAKSQNTKSYIPTLNLYRWIHKFIKGNHISMGNVLQINFNRYLPLQYAWFFLVWLWSILALWLLWNIFGMCRFIMWWSLKVQQKKGSKCVKGIRLFVWIFNTVVDVLFQNWPLINLYEHTFYNILLNLQLIFVCFRFSARN